MTATTKGDDDDDFGASDPPTRGGRSRVLERARTEEQRTAPRVDPEVGTSAPQARRYRTRRLLGRGGMGEVHLADDARIGRSIAVKLMLESAHDSPEAVARFLREARVQGQLEHPSIVPVYDVDRDETGRTFFTMKRIDGDTLEQILHNLRKGDEGYVRLYSRRKLLSIFESVCLAIDYAHVCGVVHRDLKPSNVMLGHFGEVHVLDWGVAKVAGSRDVITALPATDDESATRHGQMLGSPGYMAPEQIADASAVDATADVYALGVLLFQILTFEPLHLGSANDRLRSTTRGADARASTRRPDLDIAPELDAICVKATALDPDARYPTARALHDAVERFMEGDRDVELRNALAARQLEQARIAAQGALAPLGAACVLAFAIVGLELLWVGVRAWMPLAILFGSVLVAAVYALYVGFVRPKAYRMHAILLSIPVCIAVGASSAIIGPLFLTPMFALAVVVTASALPGLGRERMIPIVMATLAMTIPFVGEWLGFLPRAYVFTDGTMTVLPNAIDFTEKKLRLTIFLANCATITLISAFLFRAISVVMATEPRRRNEDGEG